MLGNIKFIGELYSLGILQESIMHKCIKQLINKKKKGTLDDMAEDLECLSQIMTTCGKRLDHPKAKSLMDQYFERMEVLRRKHTELPSRIRFKLQDVAELRGNNWFPRRAQRDTGPRPLRQIRKEIEELYLSPSAIYNQSNGEGFGGNPRFQTSTTGFGSNSGFQMNYPGSSRFSQSPQYPGGFSGTSPPSVLNATSSDKTSNSQGFDFFGPVKPQPIRPAAPKPTPSLPPTRPIYPGQQARFAPPPHMYNGYPTAPNPMYRPPRPSQMSPGYHSPMQEPNSPQPAQRIQDSQPPQRDSSAKQGNHKSDQKPAKEIPPRFQKQKQQKMEMAAAENQNTEQATGTKPIHSQRNGTGNASTRPRKPPVFTALNSNPEPPIIHRQTEPPQSRPYPQPTVQFTQGTPLGAVSKGLKTPVQAVAKSPRNHPTSNAGLPSQRRPTQNQRHPSPTIHETNIDAIQAPFQHAIDNASQQVPLSKKNPVVAEKTKPKKSSMSKSEVEKISDDTAEKYFAKIKNKDQIGKIVNELKLQRKLIPVFISKLLIKSLNKSDHDKDRICKLLLYLIEMKIFTKELVLQGMQTTLEKLSDLESEIPLIKSSMGNLLSKVVLFELLALSDLGEMLVGGYHFPLFLLTLQQMSKVKVEDWITHEFQESKIKMIEMLPEASQTKSAMITILEGKQLQFLFPLVHIESKLSNQIAENPNPSSIYKWIKENVTLDLYTDPGFINVLVSCSLDHITKHSSLAEGVERTQNPLREIKEKERQLMVEIKPVLQKFLHDKPKLQLHALYAAQVFCCNKEFPKGLLLRLFNGLYEEDVVDEETYYVWKEDVNEQYCGKGKALFQVNKWLAWLREAETDDEEDK
uniref:eukaryotic translation initiation factor 4 gamma 2-like isoform X1 n=1 Tax=Styela clava TaxID=7725 RepID=UPI00193A14F5|nr:eukaryotic translation initiation factor 4 gamma 2-like isoform X1 [Styela clava]